MIVQYSLLLFLWQIQINLSSMLTVWHLQLEDKLLAPLNSFFLESIWLAMAHWLFYSIRSYLILFTDPTFTVFTSTFRTSSNRNLSNPILSYSILSHPIGAQQIMPHPLPLNRIWTWICFDIIISLHNINEFEFKGFSSAAIKEQMDSFFKSLPENFQMLSIMELAEPLLIQVK